MKSEFLRDAPVNTQGNLNVERISGKPIPVPPVSEQRSIVMFIEQSVSGLEETIVTTQRELDLISEYRTRLIADVVTGKLDVREAAAALSDELEAVEPDAEELLDEGETTDDAEFDTEPEEVEA
jgi:type I restriction enzyme S subunit